MKLHWGNAIFIFFTIFIGLSITFIIFSLNQDIELVEDDYYNQGANYTMQMEIQQRSAIFKDSISANDLGENILLTFPASISNLTDSLKVYFYNPSSKLKDYKILLTPVNDSNYLDKKNLTSGRYILKLEWLGMHEVYKIEKDLIIQ